MLMRAPPQIMSVGFRELNSLMTQWTVHVRFQYFLVPVIRTLRGAPVRYHGFLASDNAYKDTTVWTEEPLPVLLFSHGMRGFGAATAPFLAEHFARQGWLVIAWDHVGDTTLDASGVRSRISMSVQFWISMMQCRASFWERATHYRFRCNFW